MRQLGAALVALLILGCGSNTPPSPASPAPTAASSAAATVVPIQGPSPSPTQTPTTVPGPTPTPTPASTPTQIPTASPSPTPPAETPSAGPIFNPYPLPTVASVNRSNLNDFWRQVISLSCVDFIQENYWTSVSQLTRDLDLIVVGVPISAEWRADTYQPIVDFRVDQVLKGEPTYARPNVIQVVTDTADYDQITAPIPAVPTVLFLRNVGDRERRDGYSVSAGDDYLYYLPTVYQNVMPEFRGRVFIPLAPRMRRWLGSFDWPVAIKGMPFDQLLDQIRRAASRDGHGDGISFGIRPAC